MIISKILALLIGMIIVCIILNFIFILFLGICKYIDLMSCLFEFMFKKNIIGFKYKNKDK
jgi:hypothetical protein